MNKKSWARTIVKRLHAEYPDADCALKHDDPFQLAVATILSAQCTDERVNKVTPALFARYPTPQRLAKAEPEAVEDLIRSTGFFRNKRKSIQGMAQRIVERHGGEVPQTMEELLELPGIARKTANVVLGVAFGKADGVVVDTHVKRLSGRLGLTDESDPKKIERELMELLPRKEWIAAGHLLILHGRRTCVARKPRCDRCLLNDRCPSSRV